MVVLGAGTGGTLTGVARKIKEKCPTCKVCYGEGAKDRGLCYFYLFFEYFYGALSSCEL
jgi:hypothetical protein